MGLLDSFDKSKNVSDESIYSVLSNDLAGSPTKELHVYTKWKSMHIQKTILDGDKNPLYFAEFRYSRPSNLKERFVQLWEGENDKGPLVGKMGSNMWMTKFHFRDVNGAEHAMKSDTSFVHSRYIWTPPGASGQTLIWKTTRTLDMEGQKKSKIGRALKLVDEQDRAVAMFVYSKFARKKVGKFIINREYNDSREFEQGVLVSGLAILEIYAISCRTSAATASSVSAVSTV
ncbi:hypothetical protein TWF696_003319 [Orbilia brochopaga]|uniref:Uncharacterized protein n=1 Tax=Orbilia brochopaga TaxID=3140254 RepID=A0AAV9TYG8_9PEZI